MKIITLLFAVIGFLTTIYVGGSYLLSLYQSYTYKTNYTCRQFSKAFKEVVGNPDTRTQESVQAAAMALLYTELRFGKGISKSEEIMAKAWNELNSLCLVTPGFKLSEIIKYAPSELEQEKLKLNRIIDAELKNVQVTEDTAVTEHAHLFARTINAAMGVQNQMVSPTQVPNITSNTDSL